MDGIIMYKFIRFYTLFRELFLEKTLSSFKHIIKALKKPFFNNLNIIGIITFL